MTYQAIFEVGGSVLVFWAAAAGVASVIVHAQVPWWRSEMGRHLMAYMSIIAAVLVLSCVRVLTGNSGDSWWFQLVRLIVFIGVPIVMTQRLLLQLKARRARNEQDPTTRPRVEE